jgi:hypothetical protein
LLNQTSGGVGRSDPRKHKQNLSSLLFCQGLTGGFGLPLAGPFRSEAEDTGFIVLLGRIEAAQAVKDF